MRLDQMVRLADQTCEVRFVRKPHYCPFWPKCGCQFPEPERKQPSSARAGDGLPAGEGDG